MPLGNLLARRAQNALRELTRVDGNNLAVRNHKAFPTGSPWHVRPGREARKGRQRQPVMLEDEARQLNQVTLEAQCGTRVDVTSDEWPALERFVNQAHAKLLESSVNLQGDALEGAIVIATDERDFNREVLQALGDGCDERFAQTDPRVQQVTENHETLRSGFSHDTG